MNLKESADGDMVDEQGNIWHFFGPDDEPSGNTCMISACAMPVVSGWESTTNDDVIHDEHVDLL